MKNKIIFSIVCAFTIMLMILVIVFVDYSNNKNNLLEGYYKLEKVITYYNLGQSESETEVTEFVNNKKLYFNKDKLESKIMDITNYYYLLDDNKLYYSLNKIKATENIPYFEYEIKDEYLILIVFNRVTETYYYKKITKEEY